MASTSSPNLVFLSLGSNIDPEKNLPAAVRELSRHGRVAAVSHAWQSPAVGKSDQPDFLNATILLETSLSAEELKDVVIASIETLLGRVRSRDKFAPRPIDIDIMLFNRDILRLGSRCIPDPEVLERPFVAIPLAEIAPHYRHPETGETLAAIAARFDPRASGMSRRDDVVLWPF
jgi:2-amino-4-hydroxy-6-hydroxymethyldihydropteridine diphosphokinase